MHKLAIIFAALGLLSAPVLQAQNEARTSPISLEVRAEKEVLRTEADGRRVIELVAVDKVLPGETVAYTITYRNSGDLPAENVVINNPVPAEMIYIDGTAVGEGTQIDYSIDGVTYGQPAELEVTLPDGTTRPADPGEYRHVRWRLNEPIPANSSGFVRYRALLR